MTMEAPKLSDARASAEANAAARETEYAQERIANRPDWAKREYNITEVEGKVTKVEQSTTTTANGNAIPIYYLHIASPRNVKAAVPVTGEAVLAVSSPNMNSKMSDITAQAYFWTVEAAQRIKPGVESIADLEGIEAKFVLGSKKPWPTATNSSYWYDVQPVAGSSALGNGHTPLFTDEEIVQAREIVVGMAQPEAPKALSAMFGEVKGAQLMSHLIIGDHSITPVEGVFQLA